MISGTAVNHGGRTSGFTVPNPRAQTELVRTAMAEAGVAPDTIGYLEAHGTGTALGDPLEIAGLSMAFDSVPPSSGGAADGCALGSVKTNIGHLESAAGIAGLTKVLLQLRHGRLVPTLHAEHENPRFDLARTPFRLNREPAPWPRKTDEAGAPIPRRAGVSAFGAGGAGAHVLVEEYEGPQAQRGAEDGEHLIVVSAMDSERLREYCRRLAAELNRRHTELRVSEIAYQLQVRREPMPERIALLADDPLDLAERLAAVATGRELSGRYWTIERNPEARRAVTRTVPEALARRDLAALAAGWVAGAEVDWMSLYPAPLRHVELPGYPFADERYWLPVPTDATTAPDAGTRSTAGHPLVGGIEADGLGTFVDFTAREYFLDHHRVGATPIFPATGYLEMVHEAARQLGRPIVRLRNNVWSTPLTVTSRMRVHLRMEPSPSGWNWELSSLADDGTRRVHGQGRADGQGGADTAAPADADEHVDIEAVRGRCANRVDGVDIYPEIRRLGLNLGPAYQGIQELWWNRDEALWRIRLPDAATEAAERYTLHPCLLDSALQGSLWLIQQREQRDRLHLPFTMGRVETPAGTARARYAHLSIESWAEDGKKLRIRICDEHGRVLVTVADCWLRPSAVAGRSGPDVPGAFFRPVWTPRDTGRRPDRKSGGTALVFAPSAEAGRAMSPVVSEVVGARRCVVVVPGTSFEAGRPDGPDFRLRPLERADFLSLVAALAAEDESDRSGWHVLFAWPSTVDADDEPGLLARLDDGFWPLTHLVHAFLRAGDRRPMRLLCAVPGTDDDQPCYAALAGYLRTVRRESPRFTYRLVQAPASGLAALGHEQDGALARSLAGELADESWRDTEIRLGGAGRLARTWTAHSPSGRRARLRRGGVYLVTGGAGGIGAIVARWLAAGYGARLVLAGRSAPDQRIERLLAAIAEDGGEAEYARADVSTPDGAQAAVSAAKRAFGRLDGVFHGAGVLRDELVVNQDPRRMREVLAPKLFGALHLDAATRDEPLELFTLFSSIAAPLGSAGQAAYGFANGFLDAFAAQRDRRCRAGTRQGHTTSVNWPLWGSGGMTVDSEAQHWLRSQLGLTPLPTDAALAALDAVLAGPTGQILFVGGDGRQVAAQLMEEAPASVAARPAPGDVPSAGDTGIATAVRAVLIEQVASTVKLDPARVDPGTRLGNYGFDSLALSRLANQLNDALGVDLTPATFFEYTTVAELVDHLMEVYPDELATALAPAEPVPAEPVRATDRTEPVPARRSAEAMSGPEPIAIVGMHAEFPGSADLDEFWRHVDNGDDLITEIPADRWDWRDFYDPTGEAENTTVSRWGGFLSSVDAFDAGFFGISPREARLMDPQQRLFLQTAYRAIEESGHRPSDLSSGRTGVFVGVGSHDYFDLLRGSGATIDAYTTTGLFHAILANRVSYLLDLKGPSIPIDTACSSSLVALRTAVESLRSGSCDAALVGGVNLILAPMVYVSFSRAGMLSPDGRCKTFDAGANGYVRGEGVAALLLKPLSAAERDGDHVHAVIRGSAVNHGGRVNTLTTPNPNAQAELIVDAFTDAGVDPATVGYVEMHGTGTALGDPIEINGLKKAFHELRDRAGLPRIGEASTAIGSVKPVIGHLEPAAGMAGIVKVVLAMKHGRLPGSPHIREPNPHIQISGSPLRIPAVTEPWPRPTGSDGRPAPRRAGVSSFGFGGANGHVLLEEYLPGSENDTEDTDDTGLGGDRVFVLSAQTEERLRHYAGALAEAVRAPSGGSRRSGSSVAIGDDLVALVADILGVRPPDVPADEPLGDLGLGPVALGELRDWLRERGLPAGTGQAMAEHSLAALVAGLPSAPDGGDPAYLRDLAYTLQLGREPMDHRLAVVCDSAAVLADRLAVFAMGQTDPGLRYGVRRAPADPAVVIPDDDARSLARGWVDGAAVDWSRLYHGQRPRRLSLPSYPFARTRYWLPAAEDAAQRPAAPEPRPVNSWSMGVRLAADDRLVAEHRVHGEPVLPGVAHLGLAHAALRRQRAGAFRLVDVLWLRPLSLGDDGVDVEVRLRQSADRVDYEVHVLAGADSVLCSQGRWERIDPDPGWPAVVDIAAVARRCGRELDGADIYRRFRGIDLDYGPLFQGLRTVRVGEDELLASFTADGAAAVAGDEAFRPAILDVALQSISAFGFAAAGSDGATRLPFALDTARITAALPSTGHIHTRAVGDGRYDITVLDTDGNSRAELTGVVVRADRSEPAEPVLDRYVFEPHWVETPVAAPVPQRLADGPTLIVHPAECGDLVQQLLAGGTDGQVWLARLGSSTHALSDRVWELHPDDAAGLRTLVERVADLRHVWFLDGVRAGADDGAEVAPHPAQTLFRLLTALSSAGRLSRLGSLRVVTEDVSDVAGGRVGNPAAAGLVGLCASLAKEYPSLAVSCVDIAPVREAGLVPALLAEPASSDGAQVALRDGRRFVRRLRPVALPADHPPVYRQGGVYLIVGGAGGIGATLAEHLARSVAAGVVLVGRRPADADTDRLVARVAELGGRAVYLAADVTDRGAMRAALDTAKARFGAVNGVFHAAMVLRDGILERMTAADLDAVYRPKAHGSAVLGDLLADEELDFLLYLSSVQSFTASAGQSNYAAASTAQDATALAVGSRARYPVQVINWGVWGTVGAVAAPHYLDQLRARGFRPIDPADGMAAVERVLGSGLRQVVACAATDEVLLGIGVRADAADGAAAAGADASAGVPEPVARLHDSALQRIEERELEDFLAQEVCALFLRAGVLSQDGRDLADLASALDALPRNHGLVLALARIAVRNGYATLGGGRLQATGRVAEVELSAVRQRADRLRRTYPNLAARLNLACACLDALPDVLAGAAAPTEVLFPDGSIELVAATYRDERLADYCNQVLAEQVAGHLRAAGAGRRARILEVGAGTGATTDAVLAALRGGGIEADYHFTDVSVRFLREARARYGGVTGVRMEFRPLDLDRPVGEQGFPDTYDVVIAANVLHAVAGLDTVLDRIQRLLAPSGRLSLTEVTRVTAFHTVTFGLLEGWWSHGDEPRRLASSPLLDAHMWRRRLESAGFADVVVSGAAEEPGELFQRVITARPTPMPASPTPVPAPPSPVAVPPATATQAAVESAAAVDSRAGAVRRVAEVITELAAGTLGMSAEDLDLDRPLSYYGVDSIVGVELINKVNRELDVLLKTIAIFDHPTVHELAAFVVDRHGADRFAQAKTREPVPEKPAAPTAAVPTVTAPAAEPVSVAGGFRAVRFERPGSPMDLTIVPIEPSAPGPGEVEILVRAFPVNFSDFLAAKGLYPMMPDFPFTPGVEVSGVVGRVGPGVERVRPGADVIALTRPEMGGQASVVVTDETFVVGKPANITYEQACGIPVAFLAMRMAFERAAVRAGERVLIRAATGTNGLMAVQLAKLAGAEVIASAGSARKIEYLASLGVPDAIDHSRDEVVEQVLRRTGGRGVDVVINTVGGTAIQDGIDLLAPEGRYVEIAVFGLQASDHLDLSRLVDNQSFHSFNAKKYFLQHPDRRTRYLDEMVAHLESGEITPILARVVEFDRVTDAYALKSDRETIGRVVVSMPPVDTPVAVEPVAVEPVAGAGAAHRNRDIAVIGMSCRFGGAEDLDALWASLADGVCTAGDVPASRWSAERYYDPDPARLDTTYCRRGAFLADIDAFDAPFFAISGKEAAQTDPQQRLFLEESWKALEDAGYPGGALAGRSCGVFVGAGPSEYLTRMNKAEAVREAQSFWGNEASVLAARISYFLNLKGPSIAVNTACSSSLVAVHLAGQSLLSGECETAIAGGVFLTLAPDYFVVASNGAMLSPDGTCKTFDADADGFGPGEGVAALVLKPLANAVRDGDHVHGVIRGSAINQDGRTNGITAPSGTSQTAVELAAYERAGVDPSTIGYVEAHGTGTLLGDPIEVEALTNAFRKYTDRSGFCAIGSVKANIGHTAAAAGIAGMIKVLLAFRHRAIPPSANFHRPNPLIDFAGSPFFVNTELRPWHGTDGHPRRATVSGFGFSGTNAHLVLEEPPAVRPSAPDAGPAVVVPLSAQTPSALRARVRSLADWLDRTDADVSVAEIAQNAQLCRQHFAERSAFVVRDRAELSDRLRATLSGAEPVTAAVAHGPATEAAEAFLSGADVDWPALWNGRVHRRISLPTYRFDRHRYWYDEQDTAYGAATGHAPVLRMVDGTESTVLETELAGTEFYLAQHRLRDEPTLPGVLYIDLALRAGRQAGRPADGIRGFQWLRPLAMTDEPVRLTTSLRPRGDATEFEIRSAEAVHARGTLVGRDTTDLPVRMDLAALRRRCTRDFPVSELYRVMAGLGLVHGPELRGVRTVHTGDQEALARMELPGRLAAAATYRVHPTLADGALQLLAAVPQVCDGLTSPLLPMAVDEIFLTDPWPESVYAWVSAADGRSSTGSHTVQVRLLDERGRVLLAMERLSVRRLDGAATPASAEPPEARIEDVLQRFRDGEMDELEALSALEAFRG
ncbi:SDR family NAD(P)-dependent oxidoreductase [Actinophytocola sp.]|uniref:SDR family NAD(P)-dependent oxidoreductase n=1 Tax=Actinophytocola sp. TaxID=1872138 RepID=UPI0025BFB37B|nr:SDR family NAD(P)-dependent oxidoreductase [Actinophytocola sp.]